MREAALFHRGVAIPLLAYHGIPTESEIRVAQAQLVGWLQGLLQGLQASMVAQQAAAARQLQQLQAGRGPGRAMTPPGQPGAPQLPDLPGTYL